MLVPVGDPLPSLKTDVYVDKPEIVVLCGTDTLVEMAVDTVVEIAVVTEVYVEVTT